VRTAALATLALLGAAGSAAAQSTRYPPPPPDADAEAEEHSDFWENAIEPGLDRYDELLGRAARLIYRRGEDGRATALVLLEEATVLLPERADAWAWLGVGRELDGDHAGCREALEKAWAIDPGWKPAPGTSNSSRSLALALGTCRSRAGDLEGAVEVLERLTARGDDSVETLWRLGEVYMALGRLDEARAALELAIDQSPADPHYPNAAWTLVIAADRARDPDATRAAAEIALRQDPQRVRVEHPAGGFVPESDAAYYAAVAADVAGLSEQALVRFRGYLAGEPDGPWVGRAREHARALRGFDTRDRIRIEGSDKPDEAKTKKAVDKLDAALRACVKKEPNLLLELSLTQHGPKPDPDAPAPAPRKSSPRSKQKPPPARGTGRYSVHAPAPAAGVRVLVISRPVQGDPTDDEVRTAISCVEKVGAGLAVPAPTTAGTWSTVNVPVIWR
jgi:tetratricopeptide (TPR) repeat protein